MTIEQRASEAAIRGLIERWATAVQARDLDSVLARSLPRHPDVRRATAERGARPRGLPQDLAPILRMAEAGATFEIVSLDVTADDDVAFATALLRCGTEEELRKDPDNRLRLTIGLRKDGGRWVVSHEHHSFPARD
jgi:ketosteroid isomerase-like protein